MHYVDLKCKQSECDLMLFNLKAQLFIDEDSHLSATTWVSVRAKHSEHDWWFCFVIEFRYLLDALSVSISLSLAHPCSLALLFTAIGKQSHSSLTLWRVRLRHRQEFYRNPLNIDFSSSAFSDNLMQALHIQTSSNNDLLFVTRL